MIFHIIPSQVSITCCPTGQMWSFSCKQWLRAHHDITLTCTHCTPANKPLGDVRQNKCLCESDGEDDNGDGKDDENDGPDNDTEGISHREQNASYEDDFSGDSSTEQSSSVEEEEDEDIEGSEDDGDEQSESQYSLARA